MHLKHCFCNILKLRIPLGTILPSLQVQVQGRLENRNAKKKEEKNSWVAQMALKTELLDYWKWIGESIIARILKSVSIDCKKRKI